MKIVAVTTYPPSTEPLSSFGYQAIKRFLECPEIDKITVFADQVPCPDLTSIDKQLSIKRCWRRNSILSVPSIILNLIIENPNLVWVNMQYNLFGPKLIPAFMGTMLPAIIKLMNLPIVLLLHDYYQGVHPEILFRGKKLLRTFMKLIDPIILRSFCTANIVFVMLNKFRVDIKNRIPTACVEYIEQDLFKIPPYKPVNPHTKNILTFGNFGTYKKIECLLDVIELLNYKFPGIKLIIAGKNNPSSPNYLEKILSHRNPRLDIVKYVGYVKDDDLPSLFWNSNIIVLTNSVVTGSSTVQRFAAIYGRGLILPDIDLYNSLGDDGWGVILYQPENDQCLYHAIIDVLSNQNQQDLLGLMNHTKAEGFSDQFVKIHLKAFQKYLKLSPINTNMNQINNSYRHPDKIVE